MELLDCILRKYVYYQKFFLGGPHQEVYGILVSPTRD